MIVRESVRITVDPSNKEALALFSEHGDELLINVRNEGKRPTKQLATQQPTTQFPFDKEDVIILKTGEKMDTKTPGGHAQRVLWELSDAVQSGFRRATWNHQDEKPEEPTANQHADLPQFLVVAKTHKQELINMSHGRPKKAPTPEKIEKQKRHSMNLKGLTGFFRGIRYHRGEAKSSRKKQ